MDSNSLEVELGSSDSKSQSLSKAQENLLDDIFKSEPSSTDGIKINSDDTDRTVKTVKPIKSGDSKSKREPKKNKRVPVEIPMVASTQNTKKSDEESTYAEPVNVEDKTSSKNDKSEKSDKSN